MEIGFLILLVMCIAHQGLSAKNLDLLYKWKELDYEFPSKAARERFIRNGDFIPGNAVPIDVDVSPGERDDRIFLTMPRFKDGIPASLVTVSNRSPSLNDGPLLVPYPDWSSHLYGNCDGLTSVFRTQIDQCNRLWVIDSGMVDLFKSPRRRLCQPQLVAFSLPSDREVKRYRFPNEQLTEGSILTTVAIDVRDPNNQCSDTTAYVADVTGNAILVYDVKKNKSWRVQSNTMYPYPPQGIFRTNNVEFDLMDGVIGLALGPVQNGKRTLYYHSFASVRESWVPTTVLKNESIYSSGFNTAPRQFEASEEARPSQTAPQAFDKHGVLYFSPVSDNAIYCWNSQNTFKSQNLHELSKDDENLQFTTGLKVIQPNNRDEELWVVTNRFHLVMVDQMKRDEVNFRILRGKLSDLTRGSPCHQNRPIQFPQYSNGHDHSHNHGHGHGHQHGHGQGWGSGHKDKYTRPGYYGAKY